jgi:RHS repeat-associated protein
VASDADGNVLTYNGTSWGSATDVDATRSVTSISCPTTTFCVTGDASGYAALYEPVPSTVSVSQLTWDTTDSLSLILSDGTYDYIYGTGTTPVEEISLATSTPTFMTFTSADSTWLTTNAVGDETGFYGYDAFGNLAFGTPTTPFGYAGEYADATTGFSDMRARWYSSQTGEFTTVDPDLVATNSAYVYALDNPIGSSDPTGTLPNYCSWSWFSCGVTSNNWLAEAQFELSAWFSMGGPPQTTPQYVVYSPAGSKRVYDLYNRGPFGIVPAAWELKVGYQSANALNVRQIAFDEALLEKGSIGYTHGGQEARVPQITWWEQPKVGSASGLSNNLAVDLEGAASATRGLFSVQVDFPQDQEDRSEANAPANIPVPKYNEPIPAEPDIPGLPDIPEVPVDLAMNEIC